MNNLDVSRETLNGFRGNYRFTIEKEYRGRPYVPGEYSGVTLDIGLDLAYARHEIVLNAYGHILDAEQQFAVLRCRGLIGRDAKILLGNDPQLQSISISIEEATESFPIIADEIWEAIKKRWPNIRQAPPEVHTAILDVVWDRGPLNRHLHRFDYPIRKGNWEDLAEIIAGMQQRHKEEKIRLRRREAASLITNGHEE